jgi:hypothetical protein
LHFSYFTFFFLLILQGKKEKTMRKVIAFLLAITLVAPLFCGCQKQDGTPDDDANAIPQLVNHIQQCSRLYTTDYRIHKVVMVQADKQ